MKHSRIVLIATMAIGLFNTAQALEPSPVLGDWRPVQDTDAGYVISFSSDTVKVTERGKDYVFSYRVISTEPLILQMTPRGGGHSEDLEFSLKGNVLCRKREQKLVDCLVRK